VPYVAHQLAALRKIPVDEVARLTSANFEHLFRAVRS
jgi:TatD DNase family protein